MSPSYQCLTPHTWQGGLDSLSKTMCMKPALLSECLELFYNCRREGNVVGVVYLALVMWQ